MPFREVGPCGGARQLPHNAGALTRSAMQNTAMPSWINFLNSLIHSRSKVTNTILVSISGGTSSKMTVSVSGEGTRPYSRIPEPRPSPFSQDGAGPGIVRHPVNRVSNICGLGKGVIGKS